MGWIASLQGKVVGLDTAPLIYFVEENQTYLETIRPFFEAMDGGDFSAVTSIITLLEVLVHPFRHGNTALVQQYRDILLSAEGLTTILLSQDIAEEAARDSVLLTTFARRMRFRWPQRFMQELRSS